MLINLGMFKDNGGCGYLMKPQYLLDPSARPVKKSSSFPGNNCPNQLNPKKERSLINIGVEADNTKVSFLLPALQDSPF